MPSLETEANPGQADGRAEAGDGPKQPVEQPRPEPDLSEYIGAETRLDQPDSNGSPASEVTRISPDYSPAVRGRAEEPKQSKEPPGQMTKSERLLGPGADQAPQTQPNNQRPPAESLPIDRSSWDYNPFYSASDLEQRLGQLECQAATAEDQYQQLAGSQTEAASRLAAADRLETDQLQQRLAKIELELKQTGQEINRINETIGRLRTDLAAIHQEISQLHDQSRGSDQVPQAA